MGKEKIRNKHGVLTATYRLGKYECVNMEEVKLLVNGTVSALAPVTVHDRRGTLLEVQQKEWTPMTAYQAASLTDRIIMTFLKYTLRIAYDCERYGLRLDNLCWDFGKVFVDAEGKVRMIYWPVTTLYQNRTGMLAFYRQFCGLMQNCDGLNPQIVQRYTSYFYQRENLDFPVFQLLLMELIEQWKRDVCRRAKEDEKITPSYPDTNEKKYFGWLEQARTGTRIPLDSDQICIGRDASRCQLHLGGCFAVGRLHAQIMCQEGQYYLLDLGSLNGTRVDGVPLRPKQPWPLANGSKILFADQKFTFREVREHNTIPIHQQKRGKA